MPKSIYFNIEDDTGQIVEKIKRERGDRFVLVFPRKSYIFADSVNLKLLKKQLDLLGKTAFVLTMDEKGQAYASQAGFELVDIPKRTTSSKFGDIRVKPTIKAKDENSSNKVQKVSHKPSHKTRVHITEKSSKVEPGTSPRQTNFRARIETKSYPSPEIQVEENIFADVPHKPAQSMNKDGEQRGQKWLVRLGSIAVIVFMLAGLLTVVLPKATIAVTPKSEEVSRQINIRASTEYLSADQDLLRLPAKSFEKDFTQSEEIQVVGKKEVGTKSAGKIRIFNLSGSSLNLRAGTTTLAVGDKQYTLKQDANYIPSLTAKAATSPNAGFLAEIEAVGFGESYNQISGQRLEITNQVFGNRPEQLYAIADSEISGGSSRFLSEIQDIDTEEAKRKLVETALSDYKDELSLDGWVLAEGSYSLEEADFSMDKPLGTETTSFNASLSGTVRGLIFKPEELQGLVRARVSQVLPEDAYLQDPKKDKTVYTLSDLKLDSASMTIEVSLESRMYRKVDPDAIRSSAKGVIADSFISAQKQSANIKDMSIEIFPKQRKKLPVLQGRIDVKIVED